MNDVAAYRNRRERLALNMERGIAVLSAAPERVRSRDAYHPYRFDSYFYYLTGFREPEAVLVLLAGDTPRSLLFCRDKDPERELWDGPRHGPAGALEKFGFDAAHGIAELEVRLPDLLADQPALFCDLGSDEKWDARIIGWLNAVRARARAGVAAPGEIRDIRVLLDEMRVIKDASELAVMRRAASISAAAHCRAMGVARPGLAEYHLEAELLHEFRRNGAQSPAYPCIVAAGPHACVLHYVENDGPLRDGDLVLIDAGCELDGYASDITRTFPVNGKFTSAQRDIYDLVLAAQAAAMAEIKAGAAWNAPHDAAVRVLTQGLLDLGLLQGGLEEALESAAYTRYYMHRTGHWLGLDVHDAGEYKRQGQWRTLQPGMALTVEPGCYIHPGETVPERYWNIGIRIEDDVVVTPQGREVLTHEVPKSAADIEALMAR